MNDNTLNKISERHQPGFKNWLWNYPKKELKSALIIPGLFSVLFFGIQFLPGSNIHSSLTELYNFAITVIPSLLGFMLGGFAIFLGFGDRDFLKSISKGEEIESYSLFHKIIFAFTFSLIFQTISMFVAFFYFLFSSVDLEILSSFYFAINYAGYFILILFLNISFYSLFQIVLIIFGIAQNYHLRLFIESIKDDSNNTDRES